MISLTLAEELKQAGLNWFPQLHDFFAIPDTELADRIFVVSDMMIDVHQLIGNQLISFNGAVEWSLDFIMIADVVWMPTEEQLRQMLEDYLLAERQPAVEMLSFVDNYRCRITFLGKRYDFDDPTASGAYGHALLHVIQKAGSGLQWRPGPVA